MAQDVVGRADLRERRDLRERPVGELMKELASQTGTLVRQEIELARVEMVEKGKQGAMAGGMFAGAAAVGLLALIALTICFIAALATGMAVWLAALIVTAVYAIAGGVLAREGRERLQRATPPVPVETVETLKEDLEWAKTRQSSVKR